MKPFFGAYFGLFKDKHCYWFGILLLIQVTLLFTFAIVQYLNVSIVAINIAAAFFYQPDNTVNDDIVHLSKWRKLGHLCTQQLA